MPDQQEDDPYSSPRRRGAPQRSFLPDCFMSQIVSAVGRFVPSFWSMSYFHFYSIWLRWLFHPKDQDNQRETTCLFQIAPIQMTPKVTHVL